MAIEPCEFISTDALPSFGLNALAEGVTGDGQTDDQPRLQALLNRGAEMLYLPPATYLLGAPLRLPSGAWLRAHPQARLLLAPGAGRDRGSSLLRNANEDAGNADIRVEGGTWDGQGQVNPRGRETDRQGYTGNLINFLRVRGLTLRGLVLRNSSGYFIRLSAVHQFLVEDIRFEITHHTANQDGVHVAGLCEDGIIRRIEAHGRACTGDDLVPLNADDALDRSETRGKLAGPIRRIHIEHLRAHDCHSFVRLASVWSEIADVTVRDVVGGCSINAVNADGLRFCRTPLFSPNDPAYVHGTGLLRNIRLSNFQVHKTATAKGQRPREAALLRLHTRTPNLILEDFRRDPAADALPQAPLVTVADTPIERGSLWGLPADMVREALAESDLAEVVRRRLPCPLQGAAAEAWNFAVGARGRLVVPGWSLARMTLDSGAPAPLPEPNWNVALPTT